MALLIVRNQLQYTPLSLSIIFDISIKLVSMFSLAAPKTPAIFILISDIFLVLHFMWQLTTLIFFQTFLQVCFVRKFHFTQAGSSLSAPHSPFIISSLFHFRQQVAQLWQRYCAMHAP